MPARVSVSIGDAPERVLGSAVAFFIVNDDGRSIVGCMIPPEEFAQRLRRVADELEGKEAGGKWLLRPTKNG